MKCPKCGNNLYGIIVEGTIVEMRQLIVCENVECNFKELQGISGDKHGGTKIRDLKKVKYQTRLSNVLSKFKRVMIKANSGNVTYLWHSTTGWIGIGYYEVEKCFKLLTNIPIQPIISLNTVESLLNDLKEVE